MRKLLVLATLTISLFGSICVHADSHPQPSVPQVVSTN
jgi:hypothetical protein